MKAMSKTVGGGAHGFITNTRDVFARKFNLIGFYESSHEEYFYRCGQGYVFTRVCDSVHRGVCLSACWDTAPPQEGGTPCQGDPPPRRRAPRGPPKKETSPERRPPKETPSRPTPKGEIEGDQVQAHTQGGN